METISGHFCPVCKFKNEISATVCAYCGTPLMEMRKGETTTRRVEEGNMLPGQAEDFAPKMAIPPNGIAIYLQDGTMIGSSEANEFYLGRKVQEIEGNLIDLIPFGAFQTGVSRQHALIRKSKNGYEITDLDSTNGTFLDGDRLVSNCSYSLSSGSQVSLGRLRLVVFFAKSTPKDTTPKR